MNDLFFRCETCKRFLDAGYRWAYWTLVQPRVVQPDDYVEGGTSLPPVSAEAVLAAENYWNGATESPRLAVLLRRVHDFLSTHREHRLSFGDIHRLHQPTDEWVGWLCDDPDSELLPRNLAEVLGLATWGEVESYVRKQRIPPWWWAGPETRLAARRKFEELVQGVSHS